MISPLNKQTGKILISAIDEKGMNFGDMLIAKGSNRKLINGKTGKEIKIPALSLVMAYLSNTQNLTCKYPEHQNLLFTLPVVKDVDKGNTQGKNHLYIDDKHKPQPISYLESYLYVFTYRVIDKLESAKQGKTVYKTHPISYTRFNYKTKQKEIITKQTPYFTYEQKTKISKEQQSRKSYQVADKQEYDKNIESGVRKFFESGERSKIKQEIIASIPDVEVSSIQDEYAYTKTIPLFHASQLNEDKIHEFIKTGKFVGVPKDNENVKEITDTSKLFKDLEKLDGVSVNYLYSNRVPSFIQNSINIPSIAQFKDTKDFNNLALETMSNHRLSLNKYMDKAPIGKKALISAVSTILLANEFGIESNTKSSKIDEIKKFIDTAKMKDKENKDVYERLRANNTKYDTEVDKAVDSVLFSARIIKTHFANNYKKLTEVKEDTKHKDNGITL